MKKQPLPILVLSVLLVACGSEEASKPDAVVSQAIRTTQAAAEVPPTATARQPTAATTPKPTAAPTVAPTSTPTVTPLPTVTPTALATPTPSATPTQTPSAEWLQVMELLPAAEGHFAAEEFDEAIALYDDMIALLPALGELYALRADAHAELNDYESAIADLVTAVDLLEAGQTLLEDQPLPGVTLPALQSNLCWFYGITGEPESALPYCEEAVFAGSETACRDSRGLVYAQLGELEAAVADFQAVVDDLAESSSPELQAIYEQRLGWLEALLGGENPIDEAVLADLRGEVVEAPPPPPAQQTGPTAADLVQQGRSLMQQGQLAGAIEAYTQAATLSPGYLDAYYYRGMAYRFSGQLDLSLADFDRVLANSPGWADAYYERGLTYASAGNFEQAIQEYTQAINLSPNDADYLSFRGLAKLTLQRLGEAVDDFNASLALRPDHALTLFNRGFAHALLGDAGAARADLQRAVELGLPPSVEQMAQGILEALP